MSNAVSIAQSGANNVTFRNRIINGNMMIDQRNAGASGTATGYTVDRWTYGATQASKGTWQRNAGSVTPPTGFTNYLGFTSSSAYPVLSSDVFYFWQPIEGFNVADLGWGASGALTITVSFWVRSSLTGTFGGAVGNGAGSRAYPFSYTISSSNTWEQKTVTIPGDTSGTWAKNNTTGLYLIFSLGAGSSNSATAGAWGGFAYAPTGAVSVVGTNTATFYITGVQLEKGSTATPFEQRLYGTELSLCQRYLPTTPTQTATGYLGMAYEYTTTNASASIPFQVTPRVPPTGIVVTAASGFDIADSVAHVASAIVFQGATYTMGTVQVTTTGLTVGYAAGFRTVASTSQIQFTGCEL